MKSGNRLIAILLGGLAGMAAAVTSAGEVAKIFYQINEENCLTKLRLAIEQSSPEPVILLKNDEEIADYLKKNREALQLLYQAADLPGVDFSCYSAAVKPEIIPVVSQTPRCIRLLMCDFVQNAGQGRGSWRALIAALRIVELTSGNPYLYGQLLFCSNIRIIFDGIRKTDFRQWHTLRGEQEIRQVLLLLHSLETKLTAGYRMAFRHEGDLKTSYIEDYLRPRCKAPNELAEVVSKYRNFYSLSGRAFFSQSPAEWAKIMDAAEAVNQALTEPVVTPREWQQRYLAGIRELKELRKIFHQLLYGSSRARL